MTKQLFYSKRDKWASVMVWGIAAVCWLLGLQIMNKIHIAPHEQLLGVIGVLLAGMAAPWFWLTTRYELQDTHLLLKSGPFFKRIAYADIKSVTDGRHQKGLSFAFSLECLQIDVANSELGYRISPLKRLEFLRALARRCHHLNLKGEELVSK